ncbi:MAG: DUF1631 family protein, partial [Gammaproteobacteria bacterium]|nr:DUF1631 family protein [Gammaproteobacteria bacterium]
MEKRAHIRQPLDLDARIITSDHSAHNCGIKDFCLGGLFIACTGRSDAGDAHQHLPVVVGDQILVDFAIDLRGKPQFFRLQARVAGIFRGGIGVEFIEPDPGALLALQELASRTQHAGMQAAPSHPAPRAPGSPGGKTLTACRQVVSRYLKTHIEALFKQASDDMFVAARDAINDVDQRLCYDTLKEIEQLKAPIDRVFYGTVLDAMEQPGMPLKKRTSAQPEQLSGLSLLDSQEFQDMLTVQRILEKTEMRHQDQLFMLLKRLSQVAMVELNDQNNPVGPVGICAAFHDSLQHLGASRMARKSIFSAFENSVIKNLDDLYTELNEVLVSDNILPSIEKPTPHVPHRPSTPTGDSSVPESGDPEYEAAAPVEDIPGAMATQHARNGSASTIGPRRHATNTIPGQAPVNDYPPTPGAAPGLSQAGMQFTAPPPSATTEIAAEGYPPPSSNALHAAQCLLNLNRQIAGAAGRGEERAAAQTPPAHPPDTYTADEVIEALSSLQRGPISRPEAPSSLPDLKSRVLTSLAAGNTDKEAKQLGGPEGDAVEVIAGLVGSILEDVLVADGMKPRISRLEPPLLKVALQEDTFLSDEAHPARQVVNQLGRIDIPSVLEPGSQEAQLGVEVDRLIEHINANYDRNSSVFSEVLGQIEGLVERQSKLYLENLEQTIKSCDKEQKVLRGLRKGGGKKGRARRDRSNAAEKNLPPEWAQWMDRINRLKTGDVLGLEKPGGISRETLAWIDDERNK